MSDATQAVEKLLYDLFDTVDGGPATRLVVETGATRHLLKRHPGYGRIAIRSKLETHVAELARGFSEALEEAQQGIEREAARVAEIEAAMKDLALSQTEQVADMILEHGEAVEGLNRRRREAERRAANLERELEAVRNAHRSLAETSVQAEENRRVAQEQLELADAQRAELETAIGVLEKRNVALVELEEEASSLRHALAEQLDAVKSFDAGPESYADTLARVIRERDELKARVEELELALERALSRML